MAALISITCREISHVVGLRADRVRLAKHFLREELELAAGAFGQLQRRVELLQVAAQPDDLLGDVAALGEDADFADQVGRLERDLDTRPASCSAARSSRAAIGVDDQRRAALRSRPARAAIVAAVGRQVGRHGPAFVGPHRGQVAPWPLRSVSRDQRPVAVGVDRRVGRSRRPRRAAAAAIRAPTGVGSFHCWRSASSCSAIAVQHGGVDADSRRWRGPDRRAASPAPCRAGCAGGRGSRSAARATRSPRRSGSTSLK